jgi:peroxiredoxin
MGWDLDAVCAILRACAYLGLQHEPGCAWAREWLVEQYEDGWFGLLLQECRAADLDPDGPRFPATVRALWTLAELRSPGFLLGADDGPVAPARMRVRPLDAQRVARRLLQPGSTAPPVRLPDLFGQGPADLADHRGRPVLLVFVDADCTPCTALVPALVELDRAPGGPDVFVVGHGEPARLRRLLAGQRPPFPVVAQEGWSVSRQYGIFTAPSAFLLGPDGVLGPPVARGPEVADLVARLAAEVGDLANLGAG